MVWSCQPSCVEPCAGSVSDLHRQKKAAWPGIPRARRTPVCVPAAALRLNSTSPVQPGDIRASAEVRFISVNMSPRRRWRAHSSGPSANRRARHADCSILGSEQPPELTRCMSPQAKTARKIGGRGFATEACSRQIRSISSMNGRSRANALRSHGRFGGGGGGGAGGAPPPPPHPPPPPPLDSPTTGWVSELRGQVLYQPHFRNQFHPVRRILSFCALDAAIGLVRLEARSWSLWHRITCRTASGWRLPIASLVPEADRRDRREGSCAGAQASLDEHAGAVVPNARIPRGEIEPC